MTTYPLQGVRVIELATVIMGPYAAQQLGDLGADVIKVEGEDRDQIRNLQPQRSPGMSGVTLTLHRNKRSVRLDLKTPEGMADFKALLASADVLLTTMRPAALDRLGLSPAALQAQFPGLIYAQAAGFRQDSDRANAPAYDDLVQAATGLVWLNEQVTGRPHYLPTILADKVCALFLVQSILAALIQRDRTGHAAHVEVPMVDTMLSFNLLEHMVGAAFEPPAEPAYGYARVLSGERVACRTKDGAMCVLPYSDQNWRDFFAFAGRAELGDDPRFATGISRVYNADALYRTLRELTEQFTTADLQSRCDAASIPAYPVHSLESAIDSEYVASGNSVRVIEHPDEGSYRYLAPAVRYDGAPVALRRHAPRPGENTEELLAELRLQTEGAS